MRIFTVAMIAFLFASGAAFASHPDRAEMRHVETLAGELELAVRSALGDAPGSAATEQLRELDELARRFSTQLKSHRDAPEATELAYFELYAAYERAREVLDGEPLATLEASMRALDRFYLPTWTWLGLDEEAVSRTDRLRPAS